MAIFLSQLLTMIDACYTSSGDDPNKPCKFPFSHNGKWHRKCTLQNDNNYWCPTEVSNSSTLPSRHGYCDLNCPRENGRLRTNVQR